MKAPTSVSGCLCRRRVRRMINDQWPMAVVSRNENKNKHAADYLDRLLHEVVEAGADTVELERIPEGLEICFMAGGSGLGNVLKDRTLDHELVDFVVSRAGLRRRVKGQMNWNIFGKDHLITVEEYDSFGESCFRLKFSKRPA